MLRTLPFKSIRFSTSTFRTGLTRRVRLVATLLCVATASLGTSVPARAADSLPQPTGPVVLTVSGNIANTNGNGRASFDRDMLKALGIRDVHTGTAWTDGKNSYSGPLVSAVLQAVGAKGEQIKAVALNDYAVEIPVSDFERYGTILAMEVDGKRFSVRDRGPLLVMYPRDDYEILREADYSARYIWQLNRIIVE